MSKIDMKEVELNWYKQIIKHIESVTNNKNMNSEEKIESISWLVRQLKSEHNGDN